MFVPSYQMHNVLNVYSKQLRQNMASADRKNLSDKLPTDQVSLTPKGKRLATMEKVSKEILKKISRLGTRNADEQPPVERTKKDEVKTKTAAEEAQETTFVFNVIDAINQKRKNTVSVEDSSFLIKRLEQLSKERSAKKMESWI
jgi:hypothetical protein